VTTKTNKQTQIYTRRRLRSLYIQFFNENGNEKQTDKTRI